MAAQGEKSQSEMVQPPSAKGRSKLLTTEDYWAVWLGLGVIALAMGVFWAGGTIKSFAVTPGSWSSIGAIGQDFVKHFGAYAVICLGFGLVFSISMLAMGRSVKQFVPGYLIVFLGSLAIFYLAAWKFMKTWHLGAPLLALLIGIIIGNIKKMPTWFNTAMRTEYYIKTGIVLLGATLPLTLIFEAGGIAFLQATIVSVGTWMTIFLVATRIFKLDRRFGAVLGTGGAVCGVSGSIAIGGAVRADKDHISIGIGVVSVWAIVMVFTLAIVTKFMIPPLGVPVTDTSPWYAITPGEAGAWVGTSEYADAAGFAVVAEIATEYGDSAIHAFTLMKVIGRDIWIGIWAFVLAVVSCTFWEKEQGATVGARVIWDRFPKFVLGFFSACIIMSIIAGLAPKDHVGKSPVEGTFKSKAQKHVYQADFSDYQVPEQLAHRFAYDPKGPVITFKGKMSLDELSDLTSATTSSDQQWALKDLHYKSDWFQSELYSRAISPIKKLRSWAFVFCFLCIGLSTRFKDLLTFGMKPFWAFTIGVIVNVPLGFFLSTVVFSNYWQAIK
ncbi:MAG: putative sulfate exporter family transporter [Thermodesulfobacteriota bacterium]|nr:putative sulfate exporter family transporter [Thermodesulfobacteriota bacterium]